MKPIKPTPQYYIAIAVAVLAFSWVLSAIVEGFIKPSIDSDAEAYILLVDSMNQTSYSAMESQTREAQGMTSDPDIRSIADFLARNANLSIRAGSQTVEEANSFSGFGKAFATGFFNPMMGIEGGLMFVESLFTDFEAIGTRLDNRYQPIFSRYRFAEKTGTVVFWILIVGGIIAYFSLRDEYEQQALEHLKSIEFLGIEPASPLLQQPAEQGVAPQSATRSESDSEDGHKPHPESEARPR